LCDELLKIGMMLGLVRANVLVGDYTSALQAASLVPVSGDSVVSQLFPCFVSLSYYQGLAYTMTRAYADAFDTFSGSLQSYLRNRGSYRNNQVVSCQIGSLACR